MTSESCDHSRVPRLPGVDSVAWQVTGSGDRVQCRVARAGTRVRNVAAVAASGGRRLLWLPYVGLVAYSVLVVVPFINDLRKRAVESSTGHSAAPLHRVSRLHLARTMLGVVGFALFSAVVALDG